MRILCQLVAVVAAVWCTWLVASSPSLTVEVTLGSTERTFVVACDSPIGGGAGTELSPDGSVDRSWEVTEDENVYLAAVNSDPEEMADIDDVVLDAACSTRRERRLGWAVLAGLLVAGLLRVALVFPPRQPPGSEAQ